MDVSVIMINYNTYELTRNALNSIFAETHDLAYEIVLVDNQSPDGSGERLAEEFGEKIRYFQAGENLGTSKAFNLGVKNSCGRYILWLNTDILIKENFIGKLYRFMEDHPDCGVCGGNLLGFNGAPAHSFSRNFLTAKTLKRDRSLFCKLYRTLFQKSLSFDYNYTGAPLEVAQIIGADMMIRRELFDLVGLFEEAIFMYCEETEFQYRVKKHTSYRIYSVPDAVMYHLEGGSFQKPAAISASSCERRCRTMISGDCVYLVKHYGKREALRYLRVDRRTSLKFMLAAWFTGNGKKRAEFSARRKISKQLLKDPDAFFSSLGVRSAEGSKE